MAGNLVAFPTETVYGLGADACNEKAIAKIYKVKSRPTDHPLIVHLPTINSMFKWVKNLPSYAISLANSFWPGPMTLVLHRSSLAKDYITGGQDHVGIRVPAHPCALKLLKEFESIGGKGIAAPSANKFGSVSPTSAFDVVSELSNLLLEFDQILDGGACLIGVESTIVDCTRNNPRVIRPGAITSKMIKDCLDEPLEPNLENLHDSRIKSPGMFKSHYAPRAKVYLTGLPSPGDGFIANYSIATPMGVVRLAAPRNNIEYAQVLYSALRLADIKGLNTVYVVPPTGDDIAVAINDRLNKSAFKQ
jgi:L-threonylcarbamoyladenylate synthase